MSLISYYKFNDNASNTTVKDEMGVNNITSSKNTSILTTTGRFGSGFLLGDNGYLNMPFTKNGYSIFSISFWIKTTENRVASAFYQHPTMFGTAITGNGAGDFGIVLNGGKLGMWVDISTAYDKSYFTTKSINDNQWHNITAVKDNNNVYLYCDTVLIGTLGGIGNGVLSTGYNCYFGWSNASSISSGIPLTCNGIYDELFFYNHVLSINEIKWLYYRAKFLIQDGNLKENTPDGSGIYTIGQVPFTLNDFSNNGMSSLEMINKNVINLTQNNKYNIAMYRK